MNFREKILTCLGKMPDRVPLNMNITSSVDKGSYLLQTVTYEVEVGERVSSYLLIPKGCEGRRPAVIACHQHHPGLCIGKAETAGLAEDSSYEYKIYHYGLELCLRGYVVLCTDNLGFEDRRPPEHLRKENAFLEGFNYEKYLFFKYLLEGSSLQGKYVFDLSRGVDLLQELEFVDASRIGVIGHSLGGQEALWLSWYDDRIKVGVSSCGFGQIKTYMRDAIEHNFAAYVPGLFTAGDMSDLVCDMAPKPFMLTAATGDTYFPIDGINEISEAGELKYAELEAKGNFKAVVFDGGHEFPDFLREEAYEWLDTFIGDM